jgi:8-oxo-dGTP diphosphatase
MTAEQPTIRVVSAEIQHEGRYLITQRSARAVLPLLWEFPGGRVRDGEDDREALVRSVHHRIGVWVGAGDRVL